jgi:hypothetical protein
VAVSMKHSCLISRGGEVFRVVSRVFGKSQDQHVNNICTPYSNYFPGFPFLNHTLPEIHLKTLKTPRRAMLAEVARIGLGRVFGALALVYSGHLDRPRAPPASRTHERVKYRRQWEQLVQSD